MHALLKTTVEEPILPIYLDNDQKTIPVSDPEISSDLKRKLLYKHIQSFDWEHGGLISPIKFLDRDSVEYSLLQAANHDQTESRMARLSLSRSFSLLDPVWGGVYQYSTQGDWDHPHYEKTMANQTGYLRIYAMAYSLWREQRFLLAANCIYKYIKHFLTSPDGAFYSAQSDKIDGYDTSAYFSSNNKQRMNVGIPEVCKQIFSRENGWAIEALATLYEYTGDKSALQRAVRAARWTIGHRSLPEGGFRHDEYDEAGPFLGDSLAMGRAMLHLYRVSGEQKWLLYAGNAIDFINIHFRRRGSGFNRAIDRGEISRPAPQIDENISLTRFANLLFHCTGQTKFKEISKHGLRFLSIPQIATARQEEAGILLVNAELNETPIHIMIIGDKNDPLTETLYHTALRSYGWYKKVECIEKNESSLMDSQVKLNKNEHFPVAYVLHEFHCSKPIHEPDTLSRMILDM